MVALSIQIEGSVGLTWSLWKQLVAEVEQLGFAGLFRSDHFADPLPDLFGVSTQEPVAPDALELVVSLTYLADHSRHVHFGPLVAPLSFRDPVMLARQAMALDDLSGGRMILGVGAGWLEREHSMFGYDLGDVATRMARLEEGLEVIRQLLRSEAPVSHVDRFYRLREASLRPRTQRPGGPPLLIGGSGLRRTLPLVARYADIWSAQLVTPEGFRKRSAHLDELLREAGRQPGEVRRTLIIPIFCGRDRSELDQRLRLFRRAIPDGAGMPVDALLDRIRTQFVGIIAGTPEEVIEQIRSYEGAGVEELVAQLFTVDDFTGLHLLAEHVLPHLQA